jgi:pimeloyl-ACP methyl ester carboxylesterase
MPRLTVGSENSAPIEIHYQDHGSGDPIVLIHGYPLNGNSWERQERELLAHGYRVISYDRRSTWLTDFRADLAKIDIPVLVVHGTEDRFLPFEATAARLPGLIADCTLVRVESGPHNIGWMHPDEVNNALLEFIGT